MFRDKGASRTGLAGGGWQRLTAVYIAVFLMPALLWLTLNPPASYAQWRQWLTMPGVEVALALFVAATALHAYVGMRDIFMDYTPAGPVRLGLLGAWTVAVAAYLAWGLLWIASL